MNEYLECVLYGSVALRASGKAPRWVLIPLWTAYLGRTCASRKSVQRGQPRGTRVAGARLWVSPRRDDRRRWDCCDLAAAALVATDCL
jgi:hypothetical protein